MKNFEQIESYLDQQMTDDERTDFEQQLERDPELRRELKELQAARAAIDVLQVEAIRQRLVSYEAESMDDLSDSSTKPSGGKMPFGLLGRGVVIVLVVACLGAFWMYFNAKPDDQALSWTYLQRICEADQDNLSSIAENEKGQASDGSTSMIYDSLSWEPIILDICDKDEGALRSEFLLNQLQLINELVANDPELDQQLATYQALIYLRLGDKPEAKRYLEQAVSLKARHHSKARELLESIPW